MRNPRILMVEDETDILSLNKQHFEEQGYEVDAARTLGEARAKLWEGPPDLVLLDVQMPDGSGYDFCAEIRKMTSTPIIYLTGMGSDDNIVKGLTEGGDDYIVKPYRLDVLSARVMAMLRRQGLSGAGRIEVPPLAIDLRSGKVTLGGVEVPLTQKELQLLAYLVSNIGQAFSAEQLYSAVWDEIAGVYQNTVRMHISNIKRKLKLDDGSPFEIALTGDRRYMFSRVIFE